MYYLYILRSVKTGRLYTGTTNDPGRRLRDHRLGNTASTRNRGPWELVYLEEFPDRSAALARERQLKSLQGGPEKFELVANVQPEQLAAWRARFGEGA
jgi:putative endonuclease